MTEHPSDQTTLNALHQLIERIELGLSQAWDPQVVQVARQQIETAALECQENLNQLRAQAAELELQLLHLEHQRQTLQQGFAVSAQFQETLEQWGGLARFQEDLSRIEQFAEVSTQIQGAQTLAQEVSQQAQQLQEEALHLSRVLEDLGGAERVTAQLAQMEANASALLRAEARIQNHQQQQVEVEAQIARQFGDIQIRHQEVQQCADFVQQEVARSETFAQQVQVREQQLQDLFRAMEQITAQLGGEEDLQRFSTQVQRLEQLIQEGQAHLQDLPIMVNRQIQDLVVQESEQMRRQFQRDLSSLREELMQVVSTQNQQIQFLKNIKCDRPFWGRANWEKPRTSSLSLS